jgi:GDP-L-fucose synthase
MMSQTPLRGRNIVYSTSMHPYCVYRKGFSHFIDRSCQDWLAIAGTNNSSRSLVASWFERPTMVASVSRGAYNRVVVRRQASDCAVRDLTPRLTFEKPSPAMPVPLPRDTKIFVSGHRGLVGSAIVRQLEQAGFSKILTASRAEVDLCDQRAVENWFAKNQPEYVLHVAGKVGGIEANVSYPADFMYDNLLIHATVLRAAWQHGVKKLLFLSSSCIYPRDCPQPMREEYLLTGPLEQTNEAYALAKITGLKSCEYYRRQHGCNFISAIPTNLYGPNDNFDLSGSHVLPALIRKFHQAKLAGRSEVTIWGSGTPRREFMHVDDLTSACLFLLENYENSSTINIGTGEDLPIANLAELVREVVYPEAILRYDSSKPDGTPRKLLDVSRLQELGWKHHVQLADGIRSTYQWFLEHPPAE